MNPPGPVFRADLKALSENERRPYLEAIWRKCERCNPYALDKACMSCEGGGSYLRLQYSALVIDAVGRLEENSTGPRGIGVNAHYVECHVIVRHDPAGGSLLAAKGDGWWGARLGMDTSGEEHQDDLILTTRRPTSEEAIEAIREVTRTLQSKGFTVTRGKAEVVTFDTNLGDTL